MGPCIFCTLVSLLLDLVRVQAIVALLLAQLLCLLLGRREVVEAIRIASGRHLIRYQVGQGGAYVIPVEVVVGRTQVNRWHSAAACLHHRYLCLMVSFLGCPPSRGLLLIVTNQLIVSSVSYTYRQDHGTTA